MNNFIIPFLFTTIAGLSTLIGAFFVFLKIEKDKLIKYSLAFAAGVMIGVSMFDLLKESVSELTKVMSKNISFIYIIIFLSIGLIIPIILDKKINEKKSQNKLYKVGILSMIAIILHNIPEGMATFISTENNISLGITITTAIALHNIPEGISIAIPIYASTNSKKKAILMAFLSGISEPIGGLIAYLILSPFINNIIMGCLLSIIIGIMISISLIELLPTSLKYKNKSKTIIMFLIGIIFMYILGKL